MTAKETADRIGFDPTAVPKEVRRNRRRLAYPGGECPRLKRWPYVCDACPLKYCHAKCQCARWTYEARYAQSLADARLRGSRQGVDQTPESFARIDAAVESGVKGGESLYEIAEGGALGVSLSTLYSWVDSGKLSVKRMDLPSAVKYKKRKRAADYDYGGGSANGKEGRLYLDFLAWKLRNPSSFWWEVDFLGSLPSDSKSVFALQCGQLHVPLLELMPKGSAAAVREFFLKARRALGGELFKRVFPRILTDNGPLFSDFSSIEVAPDTGEKVTSVFYCEAYHSNEKPSVENMNGQIRRFFPKKSALAGVGPEDVRAAARLIADRRVKSLGGMTPRQAFDGVFGEGTLDKLIAIEIGFPGEPSGAGPKRK